MGVCAALAFSSHLPQRLQKEFPFGTEGRLSEGRPGISSAVSLPPRGAARGRRPHLRAEQGARARAPRGRDPPGPGARLPPSRRKGLGGTGKGVIPLHPFLLDSNGNGAEHRGPNLGALPVLLGLFAVLWAPSLPLSLGSGLPASAGGPGPPSRPLPAPSPSMMGLSRRARPLDRSYTYSFTG